MSKIYALKIVVASLDLSGAIDVYGYGTSAASPLLLHLLSFHIQH